MFLEKLIEIKKKNGFVLKQEILTICEKNNIKELNKEEYDFILKNIIIVPELVDLPYYIQYFKHVDKESYPIFREFFLSYVYTHNKYKQFVKRMGNSTKITFLKRFFESINEYWIEVEHETNILLLEYWDKYICAKDINVSNSYLDSFLFFLMNRQTFLIRNIIGNTLPMRVPNHLIEKVLQIRSHILNTLREKNTTNSSIDLSDDEINNIILNYLKTEENMNIDLEVLKAVISNNTIINYSDNEILENKII